MKTKIEQVISGNNILILGFGKEGQSTARFLKKYLPLRRFSIADRNEDLISQLNSSVYASCNFLLGDHYLDDLDNYDLVIKSPGVPKGLIESKVKPTNLTSQTEIFLKLFRDQTIGVTGTKGKSTTSSLIYHILKNAGFDVLLLGNIGTPPLDVTKWINNESILVFEMSSHQLEGIQISPHIAVFLNLFEEHLDHYHGLDDYKHAKYNIFKHLKEDDWLIFNGDDPQLLSDIADMPILFNKQGFSRERHKISGAYRGKKNLVEYNGRNSRVTFNFSNRSAIPGVHNLMNIMATVCVCKVHQVDDGMIEKSVNDFKGLEHRLEYVGKFKDIHFYNDSIATIPEATLEAIQTLEKVDTLILGGKDRGIDYSGLVSFMLQGNIRNVILIGEVGKRLELLMKNELPSDCKLFLIKAFEELSDIVRRYTPKNGICLLSPAASSYDMFKNFEERGQEFKKIAEGI